MRRVVVTGIGLLTSLGEGAQATWNGIVEGRSAIRAMTAYDPSCLRTRLGAEIDDFDPTRYVARRSLRMMTRNDELAMAGAALALGDAGIADLDGRADRAGLFLGGNKEVSRLDSALAAVLTARDEHGRADLGRFGRTASSVLSPLFYVEGLQGASLFYVSQAFGLRGANSYFAGTADAGAMAVAAGMRAVRRGEADVVLAGGFDDAVSWWSMSKMDGLGVLTDRNDLGAAAFRPYDRDRSGSVLGEGAAFLVLEERAAALHRGARVYAELRGAGAGMDCHATLTPDPDGAALAGAIRAALADAAVPAGHLRFVAAHGCATRLGDVTETRAIRSALGPAADGLLASSVKPQVGHLVAGAGALNVAVAALAVSSGVVPGTPNLEHPDPACDLNWVAGDARAEEVPAAMALARGLGGQESALVLARDAGAA